MEATPAQGPSGTALGPVYRVKRTETVDRPTEAGGRTSRTVTRSYYVGPVSPSVSSEPSHDEGSRPTTFARSGRAEEAGALSVSAVFDVLSDERRRLVLYYLIEDAGGTAEASEIADYLGSVDPAAGRAGREAVLATLHHRHLPRMADAGLVEYEGRGGTVDYLGDRLVEECLARVAARDFDGGR